MNLIFIKDFNNYFDRIVKNHNYINDYINNRAYQIIENVNFEEKNRIDSSHIVNWKNDWVPNYMLAVEGETILSKWFVLEWDKIRGKQFKAILKGDVIAMNLEQIKNSPIFVEKGILPLSNPLLFNSENGSYNQIKQRETLLKDNTNIGWLVGYYAQDDKSVETGRVIDGQFSHIEGSDPIEDISTIRKGIYLNFAGEQNPTYSSYDFTLDMCINLYGGGGSNPNTHLRFEAYFSGVYDYEIGLVSKPWDRSGQAFRLYSKNYTEDEVYDRVDRLFYSKTYDITQAMSKEFFDNTNYYLSTNYIESLNNKYVRKDGKVYQIKVNKITNNEIKDINSNESVSKELTKIFKDYAFSDLDEWQVNPSYKVTYTGYRYVVSCVEADVTTENVRITIDNSRNHLNDAPYDMFVAPFDLNNTEFRQMKTDSGVYKINNLITLASIRSMLTQLGGSGANKFIYDVQYLPYCPIKELRDNYDSSTKTFDLTKLKGFINKKDFEYIYRTDGKPTPDLKEVVGFIAWGTKSSGTLNIPIDIKVSENNIERKVENETKLVRLVSPNYNGIFEFSPAKNNGVHYINVDYTYKPFAPYLHLNPDFSGLYGKDFNDDRGLIVGGDFSIPSISDNFINYALNNKNYQEIFNREIKHMDFTHNLNIEQQQIATGINAVTGLIGGATAGAMVGGIGGAIAGGVVGGVGSALSGSIDIKYQNIQHRENKAYQTDMFTFNLGNIKAQPQSLSKTTPFTFNNKIFPFIEEYDSTEEEKKTLRLKLKYNGMNIFKIDTLSNYIHEDDKSYFKGQLIRVNDLGDDYNMACAIYSELDKGVYM